MSGPKAPNYGFDFVVSTTQASMNLGLLEYLAQASQQPSDYYCFIMDAAGMNSVMISLDDLLTKTGGVNPFDIPAGIPTTDSRFQALLNARFTVGIKLRIGLPSDMAAQTNPSVVKLHSTANYVILDMYSADFEVFEYTPAGGWSPQAMWNVWSQPASSPWVVSTRVPVISSPLGNTLDTPFFNQNQDKKNQILARLGSWNSTAYTLSQLLLDLDNAAMYSAPTFEEALSSSSKALAILESNFISIWTASASKIGQPLIAVATVFQDLDASQFQITSWETAIDQYNETTGSLVQLPLSNQQTAVTTYDYLCMVNNNKLTDPTQFTWNWVQPQDINSSYGVVGINRQSFFQYILDSVMNQVKQNCITADVTLNLDTGNPGYGLQLIPGQTPQKCIRTDPKEGKVVIHISYLSENDPNTKVSANSGGSTYSLCVQPRYTYHISVENSTTICVTQRLWATMDLQWPPDISDTAIRPYDVTFYDYYDLTCGTDGSVNLTIDPSKHSEDDSSTTAAELGQTGVPADVMNNIESQMQNHTTFDFSSIELGVPRDFIFPGANVLSYTAAGFSTDQGLLCDFSYANTNSTPSSAGPSQSA